MLLLLWWEPIRSDRIENAPAQGADRDFGARHLFTGRIGFSEPSPVRWRLGPFRCLAPPPPSTSARSPRAAASGDGLSARAANRAMTRTAPMTAMMAVIGAVLVIALL